MEEVEQWHIALSSEARHTTCGKHPIETMGAGVLKDCLWMCAMFLQDILED